MKIREVLAIILGALSIISNITLKTYDIFEKSEIWTKGDPYKADRLNRIVPKVLNTKKWIICNRFYLCYIVSIL